MSAAAQQNTRRHGVKILLIADPPAGDKAERELKKIDGVEVTYIRGKGLNTIPTIPLGTRYVLAMNVGKAGTTLKEAARKTGAEYIGIPPGWSETVLILGQRGVYSAIKKERAGPLTQRPFAQLGIVKQEDQPQAVEPVPEPVPVKTEPTPEVKPQAAAPVEPAKTETDPVVPAWLTFALTMMERNPEIQGNVVTKAIRAQGIELDEGEFYAFRRKWRAARGLDPSGGQIKKPMRRLKRAEEKLPSAVELPQHVLVAQKKLIEALRFSKHVRSYSITYLDGEAEASFECEIKQTAKGTTKL